MEIVSTQRIWHDGGRDVNSYQFTVAPATTDSTGGGTLPTAQAGLRFYVLGFEFNTGGTGAPVTFNTKPAGAGTAISGTYAIGNNANKLIQPLYFPLYKTGVNEGLTITTGAGVGNVVGTVWGYYAP